MNSPKSRQSQVRVALTASTAFIAIFALGATASAAQTAPAPGSAAAAPSATPPADDGSAGLAEVVVTARKRVERAVDVPISLVTVDNAQLQSKAIIQMQDLATYVPDFRQSNGATGSFRSIRGGGSPGSNFAFEQSTGLFMDNISYGRNEHSFLPIFDVERVEILRGPQVIAFGNSTTSGAISVTSRLPGHTLAGNLDAAYEFNNNELVLHGGMDIPIAEGLAVRVSGYSQTLNHGWVDDIRPSGKFFGPKFRNWAGRVVVLAHPNDNFTAKIKYEHDHMKTLGSNLQAVFNPANDPNIVESNLDGVSYADQPAPYDGRRDQQHMRNDSIVAELTNQFGAHSLVSTSGFTSFLYDQDLDADVGPKAIAATHPRDTYKQYSQEFRLSGPVLDTLNYNTGVYFQHEEQHPRFLFSNGVTYGRLAALDTRADQWAVFGDLLWKPIDKFSIDVGARYMNVHRLSDQYVVGTVPLTFTPLASSPILYRIFRDIKTPDHFLMPQVVLSYQPSRDVNFYVKFVQGDKAGGVDSQYVAPPATALVSSAVFHAEKATSYEAGFKSYLFDRKLSLDVAVFRSDYNNLQVSSFNVLTNAFEVRNAATSRSQGVEFDAVLAPVTGLRMNASLAYLDAKFRKFPQGPCSPEQALLVTGACFHDLSGEMTPFNSKWTGSGGIEYRIPAGDFSITPRVDASFRSRYNPTTNDDPLLWQKGFALVDARIDLTPDGGKYTVGFFGKNLTNKTYMEVALGAPFTNRVRLGDTSRGRQLGISAGVKF